MIKRNQLTLAALLAALLSVGSTSFAQTIVYDQRSPTGVTADFSTLPTALDDINFAAGTTLNGPQILSSLTLVCGVAAGTTTQTGRIVVRFYDTLNPAANPVESVLLGSMTTQFSIPANTGTTTTPKVLSITGLDTSLATPITFGDDNIGIVVIYTNAAGTAFSTVVTPLISSPGLPTVGTSTTGVYRTAVNDDFQSTDFNAAQGNLYVQIGTVAVPEPSTLALFGCAGAGFLAWRARRSRRAT